MSYYFLICHQNKVCTGTRQQIDRRHENIIKTILWEKFAALIFKNFLNQFFFFIIKMTTLIGYANRATTIYVCKPPVK